jgi:hypothetical protein
VAASVRLPTSGSRNVEDFTIAPAGGHQRRLARGTDFGVATRQVAVAVQHCFRDRTSGIWPKNWRLGLPPMALKRLRRGQLAFTGPPTAADVRVPDRGLTPQPESRPRPVVPGRLPTSFPSPLGAARNLSRRPEKRRPGLEATGRRKVGHSITCPQRVQRHPHPTTHHHRETKRHPAALSRRMQASRQLRIPS